ncbi:MAG: hypothetical protein IK092_01500 [Muribaculaceae bacterium]|nr:hypothetical protein [Muribaculaceae bacterium]
MNRSQKVIFALVGVAMALGMASCNNDACPGNGTSLPLAVFYDSQTDKEVNVSNLTVRGIGAIGDSLLLDKQTASRVYLPFIMSLNTTQFCIDYNVENLPCDTLTFNYSAVPVFVSRECGAMYNFVISGYSSTTHVLDSIVMPHNVINYEDRVTIKLYITAS